MKYKVIQKRGYHVVVDEKQLNTKGQPRIIATIGKELKGLVVIELPDHKTVPEFISLSKKITDALDSNLNIFKLEIRKKKKLN